MTSRDIYFECAFCDSPYTKEQVSELLKEYNTGDVRQISFNCTECGKGFIMAKDDKIDPLEQIKKGNIGVKEANMNSYDEYVDYDDVSFPTDQEYYDDIPADIFYEPETQPQTLLAETKEPDITHITDEGKIALFQEAIKNIDKNLLHLELNRKIVEALEIIVDVSPSYVEACFKIVKDEFKLTARDIEAFRKDLNNKRIQIAKDKEKKKYNDLVAKLSQPPKELSEGEKQEAIAYLQHPNLIDNILRDVSYAGEVMREETNIMMLYLSAISRKFDKPISLVIFGKSSSGKSYLANAIEEFVPPEDKLTITSSSARALDYMGDQLKHKCILIQEWEGMEAIMETIRVLQSEGRISRAVSIKDPESESRKTVAIEQKCPCSVVVTTTKENIHDENSTRIFELYADESVEQTEKVVKATMRKASIKHRIDPNEKKRIIELHHNIQRLLEPLEVDIPFSAEHLTFPEKTTRHRRDSKRFLQLIKAVAFLRQKQKVVKTMNGVRYIEADADDYEIAYHVGINVIKNTLDQISDRARNVLRVCCELADDFIKSGQQQLFSINQIQEKASDLGLDFGNRPDLYKQMDRLEEYEYLILHQARKGAPKYYSVCFAYERDQEGKIINIDTPDIKEITTPSQLREKILNI